MRGKSRHSQSCKGCTHTYMWSEFWQLQKHLPGLVGSGGRREVGVDDGVLNVRVPEPVLHETELRTGVEQVRSDRMFERMEVALFSGQLGFFSVVLDEHVEHLPADGQVMPAREQDGRFRAARFQPR